jgi:hypothetical protein
MLVYTQLHGVDVGALEVEDMKDRLWLEKEVGKKYKEQKKEEEKG